jgi:DNA-binding NtrC family response regulator
MPTEPTVYVIDDEPDICRVLSDILEAAHIKVKPTRLRVNSC